ncbi:hypothetical protein E3N88_09541 [Mikania micrantha]|uniref:Reverse transcriptase domain-containing protein n=1 Tax=Mikania micrantha TaxID=192012 RepID=A0A5N6PMF5_9ASTR|nr:hypothetical protein E3N88_09541 [Mikania micrantha]
MGHKEPDGDTTKPTKTKEVAVSFVPTAANNKEKKPKQPIGSISEPRHKANAETRLDNDEGSTKTTNNKLPEIEKGMTERPSENQYKYHHGDQSKASWASYTTLTPTLNSTLELAFTLALLRDVSTLCVKSCSNIWRHPWDLVPNNHTTMSLDETTPVENQSHTTLSPGGTTVIQGKGKGLFNDSDENVRNPGITPEFLEQNRKQILLLLQKEKKEQQLKEVRAQLEFEDVLVEDADEDDAEIEVKQVKETSQPKIQGGRKENHEDGVKSRTAKKLEFEDDYNKPYRPSTARAKSKFVARIAEFTFPPKLKMPTNVGKPGPRRNMEQFCEFHKESGHTTDDCFSLRRQIESAIKTGKLAHLLSELQKTPHTGEKRKEIFMLHQLRPTVALKRPRDTGGVKQNSNHLQPWMEQDISFLPIRRGNFASNPLTVSAIIAGHNVHRVYVDTGSALEIMYEHCFLQLDEVIQRSLVKSKHVLTGFAGEVVYPVGQIQLLAAAWMEAWATTVMEEWAAAEEEARAAAEWAIKILMGIPPNRPKQRKSQSPLSQPRLTTRRKNQNNLSVQ